MQAEDRRNWNIKNKQEQNVYNSMLLKLDQ